MDDNATLAQATAAGGANDGKQPATLSRDIVIATCLAAAVRGLVWLFSLFIIGPVGGTATFGLSGTSLGNASPAIAEALLCVLTLTIAIAVIVGVRRGDRRWRRRANALGWAVILDTVFYICSVVIAVYVWGGWSNISDQYWWVLAVLLINLPLLWLGWRIARRAR